MSSMPISTVSGPPSWVSLKKNFSEAEIHTVIPDRPRKKAAAATSAAVTPTPPVS